MVVVLIEEDTISGTRNLNNYCHYHEEKSKMGENAFHINNILPENVAKHFFKQ
jgi:hypothetical protein